MLRVSKFNDGQAINEETLAVSFNQLSVQECQYFVQTLMKDNSGISHDLKTYKTSMFTLNVHEVVCMICSILGYDSDKTVDSIILGFLREIFPPTT
jgi:hypothetical protein